MERPILFSAPMVRAILEGRKTETRRIAKLPAAPNHLGEWKADEFDTDGCLLSSGRPAKPERFSILWHTRTGKTITCPYGKPGDRLWVKETWAPIASGTVPGPIRYGVVYRADDARRWDERTTNVAYADGKETGPLHLEQPQKWKSSLFMRRCHSRITLEITRVRVQRLQDISEEDAKAEGVKPFPRDPEGDCWTDGTHRTAFEFLWGQINGFHGSGSWNANPWVWASSFKVVPQ